MPARVTCALGGKIDLDFADVWIWADRLQVGYGFWCPACQVQHRGLTSKQRIIDLIDHGAHVHDLELFGVE